MARPLLFQLGETEFSVTLNKVDRSKLYGSKEIEAIDQSDNVCEAATLADDARTLIGRVGTGFGWIDADGSWSEKSVTNPKTKTATAGNKKKPSGNTSKKKSSPASHKAK